jgi:hypothetical protein
MVTDFLLIEIFEEDENKFKKIRALRPKENWKTKSKTEFLQINDVLSETQ